MWGNVVGGAGRELGSPQSEDGDLRCFVHLVDTALSWILSSSVPA